MMNLPGSLEYFRVTAAYSEYALNSANSLIPARERIHPYFTHAPIPTSYAIKFKSAA